MKFTIYFYHIGRYHVSIIKIHFVIFVSYYNLTFIIQLSIKHGLGAHPNLLPHILLLLNPTMRLKRANVLCN